MRVLVAEARSVSVPSMKVGLAVEVYELLTAQESCHSLYCLLCPSWILLRIVRPAIPKTWEIYYFYLQFLFGYIGGYAGGSVAKEGES